MKKAFLLLLLSTVLLLARVGAETKVLEEWYIILLAGRQVGYSHQITFKLGRDRFKTELFQKMAVNRLSQEFTITQKDVWLESGRFLRVDSEINMNGSIRRYQAEAVEGGIRTLIVQGKSKQENFIEFAFEVLGIYQADLKSRTAFKEGKKNTSYYVFSPEAMSIEEVSLSFLVPGELVDSTGRTHLGLLAREEFSGFPDIASTLVLSDQGEVIFSRTPVGLPLELIKVEPLDGQEPADWEEELANLNLLEVTSLGIPVQGLENLSQPVDRLQTARLRFYGPEAESLEELLKEARSDLGGLGFRFWMTGDILDVTMDALPGPSGRRFLPKASSEMSEYLKDGFHLSLSDRRLEDLLCGDKPSLRCLQDSVYAFIRNKSARFGFAGTEEILSYREGDCTEHSLLLVSLLRKSGLPSRIAYGFVLTESGFIGHAWTEVYMEGRWRWLDPSFPASVRQKLKIRIGVLDPALPVWNQMNLSLLKIAGGLNAKLIGGDFGGSE